MVVRWLRSLSQIEADVWDALVGPEGFYSSHRWLRTVESSHGLRHVVDESADGLRAALPVSLVGDTDPTVIVGAPVGHRNVLVCARRDGRIDPAALGPALEAAREWAREAGAVRLLVPSVDEETVGVLERWDPSARTLEDEPSLSVVEPGPDFDTFAAEHGKAGAKWRTERRRFERSGLRISTARLSGCADAITALLQRTGDRYGQRLSAPDLHDIARRQVDALDDATRVYLCHRDDRLVGALVCFIWRGTLYERVAGFDYDALPGAFEYFMLAFYRPVDDLRGLGLNRIHLGTGAEEAKRRRGATTTPQCKVELAV